MDLVSLFNEFKPLLPLFLVGILSGGMRLLNAPTDERDTALEIIKIMLTSLFLTIICFMILTSIDSLPYLAKVGISAFVGYFGIDKALEFARKLLELRGQPKPKE